MRGATLLALVSASVFCRVAFGADLEDPCATFTWNIGQERALFSGSSESVQAGVNSASAPLLRADRLYVLNLVPQGQVRYPVVLAKKSLPDKGFGGVAHLRVPQAGLYRLSLDEPFWVDIASGGHLLPVADHQGRRGCKAPHKILQFSLPAATELTLELVGTYGSQARLTITRAPDSTP